MSQDKYAMELEKEIFNWYCGENKNVATVFNAIQAGLQNDMQVLVPIEPPEALLSALMGNPESIKPGSSISLDEGAGIKFLKINADDEGHYFTPLFTSTEELSKGALVSTLQQPLADLLHTLPTLPNCLGCVINPWGQKFVIQNGAVNHILNHKPTSNLVPIQGSVVDMHVGAIVHPTNEKLLSTNSINPDFSKVESPELLAASKSLEGCNVGDVKITEAYNLKNADYLIHTLAPLYNADKNSITAPLSACYENSLDLALEKGCTSIAFPLISVQSGGCPPGVSLQVLLATFARWSEAHPDAAMNAYLCMNIQD